MITPHQLRALAVIAETSPATAKRFLEGQPVRALCLARLVRAAARLGIQVPEATEVLALRDREPEAKR